MLFYTGAVQNGAIQEDPSKSLGGWISSSQIQNNVFDNLFGKIDYNQVKNDLKPIRVIAFHNSSTTPIAKLRVWVEHESTSFATYKIGLVLNSIDPTCNLPYFEQIRNQFGEPFYCELKDVENEVNSVFIDNVPAGQYVGIFVQRNLIDVNNPDMGGAKKSCDDFYDEFQSKKDPSYIESETIDIDSIKIVISDDPV